MGQHPAAGDLRPLVGATRLVGSFDWAEVAARRPGLFEETLRQLDLEPRDLRRALSVREHVEGDLRSLEERETGLLRHGRFAGPPAELREIDDERRSAYERLWDLVRGRELRVEEVEAQTIWLPLYVLAAPDVAGCTAAFEASVMTGRALGWNVTVFGTGLAGAKRLRETASWQFTAAAGEAKQVLMPIDLTVERCAVLVGGRRRGELHQVSVAQSVERAVPALLERGSLPARGELSDRFSLSRDAPGALERFEDIEERSVPRSGSLAVRALGATLGLSAETEQDARVAVRYELRGGCDYSLYHALDQHGKVWGE